MSNPNDPNQPGAFPPPPPQGAPPPPGQPYPPAPAPAAGYAPPAPPVPPGMYFDPASGLTLPQGTALAPVGRRIGAYFLAIPLMIVTLFIGYLIWGLIAWGKGTTPALQVLGMRVWRPTENRPATWGVMALREIIGRFVEGLFGIMEIVGFVMFLSSKDHKSLHDVIAGTVVVHDPNKVIPS